MSQDLKILLNRFELLAEVSVKTLDAYSNLNEEERNLIGNAYIEDIKQFQELTEIINYAYDAIEERVNSKNL